MDILEEFVVTQMMMRGKTGGRWYQSFNGASYVTIPPTVVNSSSTVSIRLRLNDTPDVYTRFIGSEDFEFSCDTGVDAKTFRLVNATAQLDGVNVVSESTPLPGVGVDFDLDVFPTTPTSIETLVGLLAKGNYLPATFEHIKIMSAVSVGGDTSINTIEYKLDEPWSEGHIACDSANEDEGELWAWNGEITDGSMWGALLVEGVRCFVSDALKVGARYIITATHDGAGDVQFRIGGLYFLLAADKQVTKICTAKASSMSVVMASTDPTPIGSTLNVSVRKTTAGEKINDVEADYYYE